MCSPKGSLPALKGFVEAECELWAPERISALRSHPLGCVSVCAGAYARVYVWGGVRQKGGVRGGEEGSR